MGEAAGAPCWVDLVTRDPAAAEEFYSAVLGWQFRESETFGPGYRVAHVDGLPVAGLSPLSGSWNPPATWSVYFDVADADAVAARVRERGGTVGVGPVRIGNGARVALAAGPNGGSFGLWQGERPGRWRVGGGRAPAWLELGTGDPFAAALFYGQVLDWSTGEERCEVSYSHEENEVYVRQEGHTVAGIRGGDDVERGTERPGGKEPPRWQVYFRVSDVTRAREAALAAGGEAVTGPQMRVLGETAALRDPDGALFSVLAPLSG